MLLVYFAAHCKADPVTLILSSLHSDSESNGSYHLSNARQEVRTLVFFIILGTFCDSLQYPQLPATQSLLFYFFKFYSGSLENLSNLLKVSVL